MSKKKIGAIIACSAVAGIAVATGISYFTRYKQLEKDLQDDFDDFEDELEDDIDEDCADDSSTDTAEAPHVDVPVRDDNSDNSERGYTHINLTTDNSYSEDNPVSVSVDAKPIDDASFNILDN